MTSTHHTFVYLSERPVITGNVLRLLGDEAPPITERVLPVWTGAAGPTMLVLDIHHVIGFVLRDNISAYGRTGISGVTIYTSIPNLCPLVLFVEPLGASEEDDPRDRCEDFARSLTEALQG